MTCPKNLPVLCKNNTCNLLRNKCEYRSEESQCADDSMAHVLLNEFKNTLVETPIINNKINISFI